MLFAGGSPLAGSTIRGAAVRTRSLQSTLLVLAAVALFAAPFLPLWSITLDAPQYPEGMGMLIWAHTVTGESPHDLDIINQLNHYIGMKAISPESIPELRFMRPLILAFGVLCLLAAARPRLWSSSALLAVFIAAGLAGMADFWYWGYDYGHNLDPKAAIKVPGASFQPPLVGPGSVLNFQSSSWPAWGGLLLLAAGLLIATAAVMAWRDRRATRGMTGLLVVGISLALSVPLAGCVEPGPSPVHWGEDACHHCKMTLVEKGYAAQRVNAKGKVFKYDAIECLAGDLEQSPLTPGERAYVSDRSRPDAVLMPAEEAFYLHGKDIPSPMGGGLAAFASPDSARAWQARLDGEVLTWAEVRKVKSEE